MLVNSRLLNLLLIFLLLLISAGCSKKEDSSPLTPVTDVDGNVYNTVKIGSQTWMVENLKTSKYRNGDVIPANSSSLFGSLTTGAISSYYNSDGNTAKYGRLYNWYAVHDTRNIAPIGWHVSTDAEWVTLLNYVGSHLSATSPSVCKALAAKTDWAIYTGGPVNIIGDDLSKNNSTGLTLLPGGENNDGSYDGLSLFGVWWCSDEVDTDNAVERNVWSSNIEIYRNGFPKSRGFSVRCVKDY